MTPITDPCPSNIEHRKQPVSGNPMLQQQQQHIQERAFANWCNIFLKRKGFQISSLSDLEDGVCLVLLLEVINSKQLDFSLSNDDDDDDGNSEPEEKWKVIFSVLEEEKIYVPVSPGR